ncbi:MAG: acyl-CoA thioesterase [Deltaproteobacteria bacterium]|nr:acyl-CoA thioesterase [Deltaproteobacteria bacterium]
MSGESILSSAPTAETCVSTTIPFHDCDPLGIVWHGRYLEYFELARAALFVGFGLDVPEIRDLGYRMYVVDVRCRYTHPLAYGETAEITARLKAARPLIRVVYTVRNATRGRTSARGHVVLATTDAAGSLFYETPDAIFERLVR